MKFFSLNSSKKLAEMGCVTDGQFGYDRTGHVRVLPHNSIYGYALDEHGPYEPAFTPLDFLSSEEYALENCRKLWPGDEYFETFIGSMPDWQRKRIIMLDAPDQIKFVEEFL